jgi:Tfp pilus assembly PilM family ATPase
VALGPFFERWRPPAPVQRSAVAVRAGAWRALVAPERPQVAVEVRPTGVGVVRTRRERRSLVLAAAASLELAPDVLSPTLTQPNIADPESFRSALRSAIERAGVLDGAPIALVLPDLVARVALIPAAELGTGRASELDEVVRFRLRKSLPFDVREARVAHMRSPRPQDPVVVVAAMSSVLDAYEEVCRSLRLEPGLVELSGLALCRSAFGSGASGDRLLVNWDEGYATLVLVREGWPVLVRTLTGPIVSSPEEVAREAAQTLMYARERLGSRGLEQVLVRSTSLSPAEATAVLETPLGVSPEMIEPWRALGTADPGPAAQALAGAAACLGAPA